MLARLARPAGALGARLRLAPASLEPMPRVAHSLGAPPAATAPRSAFVSSLAAQSVARPARSVYCISSPRSLVACAARRGGVPRSALKGARLLPPRARSLRIWPSPRAPTRSHATSGASARRRSPTARPPPYRYAATPLRGDSNAFSFVASLQVTIFGL